MELAIFWLPLIAGLLLGGLAVGAWYGGNKTLAIWVGFIGAACLLLIGALQAQQYVWRTTNQPNITVVAPTSHCFLRWDPPTSYQLQINNSPTPQYGAWTVQVLKVLNTGLYAQDGMVRWSMSPFEIRALVDSSGFKAHRVTIEPDRITLGPQSGPGVPFQHPLQWSTTVPLPFIT